MKKYKNATACEKLAEGAGSGGGPFRAINKSASNSDLIDLREAADRPMNGGIQPEGNAGAAAGAGGGRLSQIKAARLASSVTFAAGASSPGNSVAGGRPEGSVGLLQDTNMGGTMGGAGLLSNAGGPGKPRGLGPKVGLHHKRA